jgi:hypothetical protein
MKSSDQPLANDDFPLRARDDKLLRKDGSQLALVANAALARELADRLNRDQDKRYEENWSA